MINGVIFVSQLLPAFELTPTCFGLVITQERRHLVCSIKGYLPLISLLCFKGDNQFWKVILLPNPVPNNPSDAAGVIGTRATGTISGVVTGLLTGYKSCSRALVITGLITVGDRYANWYDKYDNWFGIWYYGYDTW